MRARSVLLRLSPLLVPFLALFAGGVAFAVAQSLGFASPVDVPRGLHAYRDIFSATWFWSSLLHALAVGLLSAVIACLAGLAVAWGIWRLPAAMQVPAVVSQVPLILPHITVGFVVLLLLGRSGLAACACHAVGLISSMDQFPALVYSSNGVGLITAYALKGSSFVVLMVLAALRRFDARQLTVARMLGSGRWRSFRSLVLPHLAPALGTSFIILFLFGFGAVDLPLVIGASRPEMVSVLAYRLYFHRDIVTRPRAMAILVVVFIVSAFFIWLYSRLAGRQGQEERRL